MEKFNYPIMYGKWYWESPQWFLNSPWDIKGWFFKKWDAPSKNCIFSGVRICGFQRIDKVWTCSKKEAKIQYNKSLEGLNNFIKELIRENRINKDKDRAELEETRLFK